MRRKIALMMALVMAGMLTACGGTKGETGQEENRPAESVSQEGTAADSEETAEIPAGETVETVIWTDSTQLAEGLQAAVDLFMADNPQYQISIESFPGSERPEKLALAKQGNSLPSLFLTAYFTSADEIHQGTILPLTDVVNEFYAGDISDSLLNQVKIRDDYYMIPVYSSPQGMLYNADIFKAAGLEEFVTESPEEIAVWKLADLDGKILPALKEYFGNSEKYPMALYAGSEQNDSYLINLLWMNGGEVFKDGKCVAGEDENTIKALKKLKEWFDKGYTNSDVATRVFVDCNADFQKQNVAISAGQFATYNNHLAAFEKGDAERFDIRVAAVPREETDGTDSAAMHEYVYGFVMMNVDEAQQRAAKAFLGWLSAQEDEVLLGLSSGIPASSRVATAQLAENPIYQSYMDAEKYIRDFTGAVPGFVSTRAVFYPAIQSCITGEQDEQSALEQYETQANEIIKEYTDRSLVLN
ncbi:MAG: ABC transporter substrate-binding protein [Eubacteriales bacterium]|nr:ABC transporter substrate-binding protein [Eubacteriales bacterium]